MRTLRFIVDKQIIRQDPNCDFGGLVPGTVEYLKAEFAFSPDWKDVTKAAIFWSVMGRRYAPQILKDGKTCIIPAEALKKKIFKVQIIGKGAGSQIITTNKVAVIQKGDKP